MRGGFVHTWVNAGSVAWGRAALLGADILFHLLKSPYTNNPYIALIRNSYTLPCA